MNMTLLDAAWQRVREAWTTAQPRVALMLGSGWSAVTEGLAEGVALSYADIPGLGATRVEGHPGRVGILHIGGLPVLVFQGRRHWYEGEGWEPVAIPIYICRQLGVRTLLLTNASGGVRADLRPGTLVMLDDHINLMGGNPLIGPHHACWGARFVDQTTVYAPVLKSLLMAAAAHVNEPLQRGVYLAVAGPVYETPAEIVAFRQWGADLVGMSTVPEALLASAAGVSVAALSCVANFAAGLANQPLSHSDIVASTQDALPRMRRLLVAFFERLAAREHAPAP